ncbi:SH3 domain-containing protein [Mariniflexile litorale]|uniref:SH3 domain-containing protein n=1 Tax=Mariniflexile litorale TaxID=3045158 RepID=A0AAU7ECF3_9FLAO|nr:SH3 domain-containing protein [Mariniflexile sp. KMM 9835]MDQ8213447.1 SH3 domain-containing protein [Mariniflexile sp. KMM 9835]
MKKILGLIFLLFFFKTNAQEYFSVIAENGLSIRNKPNLNSEKIGKLEVGKDILLIKKSGQKMSINDNNQLINGEWYEIESTKENPKGYVFSGYLLEKKEQPNDINDCEKELPCYSSVSFENFDLKIYNYQIQKNITKKQDTIQVIEHVFNQIGDKLLQIIPKQKKDSIRVSYMVVENINEQYDYRKIKPSEYDDWFKNRVKWKGQEPFVELKNNLNFYRIPKTEYEQKEILRKQNFKLKDTLVDLIGKSPNVATLIYKGKACTYGLGPVIIRIELYSENREKIIKFLVIDLSYGC